MPPLPRARRSRGGRSRRWFCVCCSPIRSGKLAHPIARLCEACSRRWALPLLPPPPPSPPLPSLPTHCFPLLPAAAAATALTCHWAWTSTSRLPRWVNARCAGSTEALRARLAAGVAFHLVGSGSRGCSLGRLVLLLKLYHRSPGTPHFPLYHRSPGTPHFPRCTNDTFPSCPESPSRC